MASDRPIADRDWLERGALALGHRGPDGEGHWWSADGRVGLAHRRLAILDLSPLGHQPMGSPCGRYVLVFNGEIYNYLELRAELAAEGVSFAGHSDTEVLLYAYRQWGTGCVERLRGMFAFALWDAGGPDQRPRLFFARDRVGKKPLYLARGGRTLRFASELKALGPSRSVDAGALNAYLALGYVPGSRCIAAGIEKLPPAHAGVFEPATGTFSTWRYWSLPPAGIGGRERADTTELLAELRHGLTEALRMRLRSDVPVGVLLSGGLDSSLVTALACEVSERPILTFTATFPGSSMDESEHALRVARHFGTEHHVLEVADTSLDVLDDLGRLVDEPLADSSLIPTYLVSRLTARHVKVVLGGDGGDELFGGYPHYATALADQRWLGWLPRPVLRPVAELAGRLPAGVKGRSRLYGLRGGAGASHIWASPFFDAALRRRLLHPDLAASLASGLHEPESWLARPGEGIDDPVQRLTRTDFATILPDRFLVKVDRASMACGLEVRCPYLDHRLVELAFGAIPSHLKVQAGRTRILQKALGRALLPPGLEIERKQGFSVPLDDWLRGSRCQPLRDLRPWLPDALNGRFIDRLIDGQMRGRANGARLFSLMMLAYSCRNAARADLGRSPPP